MRRHAVAHGISAVSVRSATKAQLVRMLSQHYIEAHGIQVVQGLIVDNASPSDGEENWQEREQGELTGKQRRMREGNRGGGWYSLLR